MRGAPSSGSKGKGGKRKGRPPVPPGIERQMAQDLNRRPNFQGYHVCAELRCGGDHPLQQHGAK